MQALTPPDYFWQSNQSFVFFGPPEAWPDIEKKAIDIFNINQFEITRFTEGLSAEEARFMRSECYKTPTQKLFKLIVVHNLDQISPEAANTLLKVIEEPPSYIRFLFFASTKNIIPTILSRCSSFTLHSTQEKDEPLLALDPKQDFATVSMTIAKVVANNEAEALLTSWTRDLVHNSQTPPEVVQCLITLQSLLRHKSSNSRAILETAFLLIAHPHTLEAQLKGISNGNF